MDGSGLMTAAAFGTWQPRRPAGQASAATPAATPAAPANGDLAAVEVRLNEVIAALGAQQRPRPAVADPGDLGELAGRMDAASAALAATRGRGSYAGAQLPDPGEMERWEAQLGALVDQDPAARRPAPEAGSVAASFADIRRRLDDPAGLDSAARHQLGLDLEAAEASLDGQVRSHAAQTPDPFEAYGPRRVELDVELAERARSNPRALSSGEASSFEQQLNAQIGALDAQARNPAPPLPSPAPVAPAKPAGPAAKADPLADVDPMVLLQALERLGVDQQTLAGLLAGGDSEGAGDGA